MATGVRAGFAGGKKPDAKKPGTALVIPKPINLPSRRKENNGFDPSIQLVPGGSAGSWMGPGGRPGVALPAGMPVGAGSYMGQQLAGRAAPGQAGTLAAGAPRTSGPPAGWGAAPTANSAAAVSGAGRTGDFPELGGPSRPANIWKAPAAAAPSDDRTVALRKPSREGRGGNGRDWAEDDEEEPMDFRRPVVIERDSSHANTAGASSSSSSSMVSTSPSAATKPPDAVNVMQRADPREEARILALKKQVLTSLAARSLLLPSSPPSCILQECVFCVRVRACVVC